MSEIASLVSTRQGDKSISRKCQVANYNSKPEMDRCHILKIFLCLGLVILFLPLALSAKSIADLRLGNVSLGYQFSGGVEAIATSNITRWTPMGTAPPTGKDVTSRNDVQISGIAFGVRNQGFRFLNNKARFTWDTSLLLSPFSAELTDPGASPGTRWNIKGILLDIRTGPGLEFRIADEWLLKLGAGLDSAYLDATLTAKTKTRSKDWHFGGHLDGSVFYVPHRNFSIFGGGGLEKIGRQSFVQGSDRATLDLSSNCTLSTGIVFPW